MLPPGQHPSPNRMRQSRIRLCTIPSWIIQQRIIQGRSQYPRPPTVRRTPPSQTRTLPAIPLLSSPHPSTGLPATKNPGTPSGSASSTRASRKPPRRWPRSSTSNPASTRRRTTTMSRSIRFRPTGTGRPTPRSATWWFSRWSVSRAPSAPRSSNGFRSVLRLRSPSLAEPHPAEVRTADQQQSIAQPFTTQPSMHTAVIHRAIEGSGVDHRAVDR